MILGLVATAGFLCCVLFSVPLGIAAIVTGVLGLQPRPPDGPRVQAIVGIVFGAIGCVAPILLTVAFSLPSVF